MKKGILFLLLAVGFSAGAQQSLKDLLYSGKLKSDANTVIRKGDDLTAKIDTSAKKPEIVEKTNPATTASIPPTDTLVDKVTTTTATDPNMPATNATVAATGTIVPAVVAADSMVKTEPAPPEVVAAAPPKSNTKLWKEYIDSLSNALKTEVLPNKKIKKETYYITVEYEINVDGQTNILSVISDPEHSFLQSEVKNHMELTAPKLAPVTDSSGKARKVKRRYNFSLTKE